MNGVYEYCKKHKERHNEVTVYPCGHVFYYCCSLALIKHNFIDCPSCMDPNDIIAPITLFTTPLFKINGSSDENQPNAT